MTIRGPSLRTTLKTVKLTGVLGARLARTRGGQLGLPGMVMMYGSRPSVISDGTSSSCGRSRSPSWPSKARVRTDDDASDSRQHACVPGSRRVTRATVSDLVPAFSPVPSHM